MKAAPTMTDLPQQPPAATPRSPYTGTRTRFSSQYQAFPNSIEGSMASWVPMSPSPATAALSTPVARHESTGSWKPVRMSLVSPGTKMAPPPSSSIASMESWSRPASHQVFERTNPFDDHHQVAINPKFSSTLLSASGASESGDSKSSWPGTQGLLTAPHTASLSVSRTHSPADWETSSGDGQWPRPMSQWQGNGVKPIKMLPTETSSSRSATDVPSRIQTPLPRKGVTTQLPTPLEQSHEREGSIGTKGGNIVASVNRRFVLFNIYLIFRPFFTSIAAIISTVIIMLATRTINSPISAMFIGRRTNFMTTRLPLPAFLAEDIAFSLQGYCLSSGVCYHYGGSEFNTKTGIWLPEDTLFTTADCMYAAFGAFACLFAAVHSFTAVIQIYLLKSLNLPLGYLTDRDRSTAEVHLEVISSECNMSPLFWAWWAHTKSPLGPVLVLLTTATGVITFGLNIGFRSLLGEGSSLGPGSYIPLAVVVLISDPLCHAAVYLGRVRTNYAIFCDGPRLSNISQKHRSKSKSQSTVSSKDKSDRTTGITQKGSTPMTLKTTIPGWTKRIAGKNDDRRRSSGTSFFNTPNRRPTITSAEIKQGAVPVKEPPHVPPVPSIPATPSVTSPAATSRDSFRTASRATSMSTKKALVEQIALAVATTSAPKASPLVEDIQRHRLSTIDSDSEHTDDLLGDQLGNSVRGSMLSSNSYDNARWLQEYKSSPALANIMYRLNAGQEYEPYVLSADGLLYNYIPDPEGTPDLEVPRLVPPEGPIRLELIEDAVDDVKEGGGTVATWKAVMSSLSSKYWWEEMLEDVDAYMDHS